MLYISKITYLGLTLFVFLTDKNTIGNVYRPNEEFQEADRAVAVALAGVCPLDLYFKPVFALLADSRRPKINLISSNICILNGLGDWTWAKSVEILR